VTLGQLGQMAQGQYSGPGEPRKKSKHRKAVDFCPTIITHLRKRLYRRDYRDIPLPMPTKEFRRETEPIFSYNDPAMAFCTRYIHTSISRQRSPIHCCLWTPEGRRLITASKMGQLTLWNGKEFNFEHVEPAHSNPIRAMTWSPDDMWMVTSDEQGIIKYWQSTMTNLKEIKGHAATVRDISFCPTSKKFATASDDRTIKVWDFASCTTEQTIDGHDWDVKTVDWHPTKGLLASGSKDNTIRLWDPRSGKELCSLHAHNNTITRLRWNRNGLWFVTGSRDQHLKIWDIRTLKSFRTFYGHKKTVNCIAWHPSEEEVFATAGYDGSIMFWTPDSQNPQAEVPKAHDHSIEGLAWHPLGHVLASCSNDRTTKFWGRNRPGDDMMDDIYNVSQLPEDAKRKAILALEEVVRNNPKTSYRRRTKILQGLQEMQDDQGEEIIADQVIPGIGSATDAKTKKEVLSLLNEVILGGDTKQEKPKSGSQGRFGSGGGGYQAQQRQGYQSQQMQQKTQQRGWNQPQQNFGGNTMGMNNMSTNNNMAGMNTNMQQQQQQQQFGQINPARQMMIMKAQQQGSQQQNPQQRRW